MQARQLDFTWPTRTSARSPGLHLSDLIREYERLVLGDEKRPEKTLEEQERAKPFWEMGLLWEQAFEIAFARAYGRRRTTLQQYEVKEDGIFMTIDSYNAKAKRIEEFKWTRRSIRYAVECLAGKGSWDKHYPGWMMQIKAYARYWGVIEAELIAWFNNGDWRFRDPRTSAPTPLRVLFSFSERELEENWRMVLGERDAWIKRGGPRPYQAIAGVGSSGGITVPASMESGTQDKDKVVEALRYTDWERPVLDWERIEVE